MRLVLDPRISNGDFINKTLIACREAFGKNDPSQLPLDLLDALIFFLRFKKITSQDRDSCIQFAASLLLIRNQKLRIIAFEIILSLNPTEEFILKFLEDSNCRIRDMAIQHGIGLNFKDHRKWKAVIFKLLQDENESIRLYSLRSMWILHNETMSSEFNLDETFLRLCDAVNDPNPMIRKNACSLMGTFQNASINMLLQTLSKKMYVSTGNDLGTEKRIKLVDSSDFEFDEANVVISATYGAFIHGTEDEFMLVRSAAIDAMYEIGVVSNEFAIKALGFLVDMFNDEDPAVRVKAVHSIAQLNKISTLTLTDDTVSSVTLILLDKDPVVRQLSCKMLRGLRFQTTQILEEIVKVLIKGISSHPEDEEHIMLALSGIGRNHTSFIVQLIPKLFLLNVEFLPKEFKIDDKNHLSHLVLVFNSVYENENILKSLPTYVLQRYSYVREKYPAVIPDIAKLLSVNNLTNIIAPDIFNNSKSQGTVIGLVKTVLLDVALKLDSGVLNSKEIVQCEIRNLEMLVVASKYSSLKLCKALLVIHSIFMDFKAYEIHPTISTDILLQQLETEINQCSLYLGLPTRLTDFIKSLKDAVKDMVLGQSLDESLTLTSDILKQIPPILRRVQLACKKEVSRSWHNRPFISLSGSIIGVQQIESFRIKADQLLFKPTCRLIGPLAYSFELQVNSRTSFHTANRSLEFAFYLADVEIAPDSNIEL